jgi:dTDP-4-dehydrorhamnose reductase
MQTKEIVIKARKPVIRSYVHIEDIFNICFSWVNDENNVSKKLIFDSRNHKDVSLLELAQQIINVVDINGNIISDIKSEDADIYIGNGVLQNKICQQYGIELSSYDKIILDTYYFLSNAKYNT